MRPGGRGVPEGERDLCGEQVCLGCLGRAVPVGRTGQNGGVAQETAAPFTGGVARADNREPRERLPAPAPLPPEEPNRLGGVRSGELGIARGQRGLRRAHQGVGPVGRCGALGPQQADRLLPVAKGVGVQAYGKQCRAADFRQLRRPYPGVGVHLLRGVVVRERLGNLPVERRHQAAVAAHISRVERPAGIGQQGFCPGESIVGAWGVAAVDEREAEIVQCPGLPNAVTRGTERPRRTLVLRDGLTGAAEELQEVSAAQPDPSRRDARCHAERRIQVAERLLAAARIGQGDAETRLDVGPSLVSARGGRGQCRAEVADGLGDITHFPGRDAEGLPSVGTDVRVAAGREHALRHPRSVPGTRERAQRQILDRAFPGHFGGGHVMLFPPRWHPPRVKNVKR